MDWYSKKPLFLPITFVILMAIFGPKYWFYVTSAYILFNIITSKLFHRVYSTLPRDFSGLCLLIRVKLDIRRRLSADRPLHEIFLENVRKHPHKDAIIEVEHGRRLSFEQLNSLANQYADFFKSKGYKSGDVASMFLENGADFVAIWLGLSKIGVITAWINSYVKLEPLAHSVKAAKSKCIISSRNLLSTLGNLFDKELLPRCDIYVIDDDDIGLNGNSCILPIKTKIAMCSTEEPKTDAHVHFKSVLCYIYTSGTTGNPKPALIKHFRYYWIAMGSGKAFGITANDRMYVMMPMYHSAGGILGVGQTVVGGSTSVIRKKFSASNFWKDCVKYDCTASQYIGEICRYLLAQKVLPEEKQHKVRVMYGNGLRGELWPEFVSRFNVQKIGEFYGSTEGNSNIVNLDNRVGSCGFFPIYSFLTRLYPVRILKIDEVTGEFIRDKNGLCVPCRPGETGEIVGVIRDKDPLLRFEGYVCREDTNKKIIRNALGKGDAVFSSGDVVYWDEFGYLFFKDRRGDTFRWKGENVSTTEVEGILQPIKAVADVTVFGVEIPKKEGRAGMAAMVPQEGVPVQKLAVEISSRLSDSLPSYAIPLFVRFCKQIDQTATFKLKKTNFQKEGFDLARCNGDAVFYWDYSAKLYRRMDAEIQRAIENGTYICI